MSQVTAPVFPAQYKFHLHETNASSSRHFIFSMLFQGNPHRTQAQLQLQCTVTQASILNDNPTCLLGWRLPGISVEKDGTALQRSCDTAVPWPHLCGRTEQRTLEKSSQKFSKHSNVVQLTLKSANICMHGMAKRSGMLQLCKMHLQREFHMELLFLWCQTLPFFIIKLNKASQRVKRLKSKKGGKKRYFRPSSIQKVKDN